MDIISRYKEHPGKHNPPHFHVFRGDNSVVRYEIDNFEAMDYNPLPSKVVKAIYKYWLEQKEFMKINFCEQNPKLCESRH